MASPDMHTPLRHVSGPPAMVVPRRENPRFGWCRRTEPARLTIQRDERRLERSAVPLSDNEQQILRQIEQQLEADQRFAQAVSSSGLYRPSVRRVRWAALGAVVSLVAMVAALQVHFAASFAGFLAMLACVLVIERELRRMGKVGMSDIMGTLRDTRDQARKMREKFGRDVN